jgi:Skp family chaperone for outer membrane proteins
MDDKAFELIEKLYSEFSSFKEQINQKIDGLDTKVDGIDKKADKNTILLERMNDKMQILAEVQQNHLEINERQYKDINNSNTEQMQLLKNALQHVVHNMD